MLLSFMVTAIILFGSWFVLQFFGQEKPITDWIEKEKGVHLNHIEVTQQRIDIELSFEDKQDFGLKFVEFKQVVDKVAKDKLVKITIQPEQSEYHPWWLENSAPILEALKRGQYTEITRLINHWQKEGKLSSGYAVMNSEYLFIYLKPTGKDDIYLVFPVKEIVTGGGERID